MYKKKGELTPERDPEEEKEEGREIVEGGEEGGERQERPPRERRERRDYEDRGDRGDYRGGRGRGRYGDRADRGDRGDRRRHYDDREGDEEPVVEEEEEKGMTMEDYMKQREEKKVNIPKKLEGRKAEQIKGKNLEKADNTKEFALTIDSKLQDKDTYNVGAVRTKEQELLGFSGAPGDDDYPSEERRGRGGRGGRRGGRGGRGRGGDDYHRRDREGGDYPRRGGRGGHSKQLDHMGEEEFPAL